MLLIGAALSALAFGAVRKLEDDGIARDLKIGAIDRFNAVQHALIEHTRLLESVGAYFQASPDVDLEGFRTFVTPLLPHSPHLQAISYAHYVPQAERDSFERVAAAQYGKETVRITERDAEGRLIPAGSRPAYSPVLFIEPMAGNEPALGFDLLSEADRRAALEAARDSGRPHTTRRLQLVQDRRSRTGLLAALPIFRSGAKLNTVADRREALEGYATQVYWLDELISSGMSQLQPGGIDLYFYDMSEPPDTRLLHVHASRIRQPGDMPPEDRIAEIDRPFVHEGTIDLGNRALRVVATATPGFVAAGRGGLPWVLLFAGVLSAAHYAAYLIVTARRENALRRALYELDLSANKLRHVLQNIPVLMIAFDSEGKLIVWNRECERVTGYAADEVLGEDPMPALGLPSPAGDDPPGGDAAGSQDFRGREMTLRARDGTDCTIAWSNVSGSIPVSGWRSWFIGVDVSEREAFQKQLLHGQKLESLGVMAGGIAHDFNNLLTAILGNVSQAQAELSQTDPSQAVLQEAVKAADRAAMLTKQLLAYAGKTTLQPVPIKLSEHVREIAELLRAAISKKVSLVLDLDEDLPAVLVDPAQIQQLVMNLVVNGAEACGDRPGTVRMRTSTSKVDENNSDSNRSFGELAPGTYVCLEVSDDGIGMYPETREQIFDPFFSTKFAGRGLGLAAAIGIVRSHNGSISVESTPGKGSVFRVLLPASAVEDAPRIPDQTEEVFGDGSILVVDDEPLVLRAAGRALERLGYRVVTANSGSAAIDYFSDHGNDVDCVLLDMTMPDMDGRETFEKLRHIRPGVPVILTSGYSEVAAAERFDGNGPAGFIQKPYTIQGLGEKIGQVITVSRDGKKTHRPDVASG